MSTTIKADYHLRTDGNLYPQKPGMNVELEVSAKGFKGLGEIETARILTHAVNRFEKALKAELERTVEEKEDDAADS